MSVFKIRSKGLRTQILMALVVLGSATILTGMSLFTSSRLASADPAETSFSFAQVPDTQNETNIDNSPLLGSRYQWLITNKQALNLKFIAQTGDNVNWGVVEPAQFTRVSNVISSTLDNDGIPYSLAIGNHDTAAVMAGGSAAPGNVHDNLRNTTAFNQTFPLSRFKNVGGTFEANKVDNMWQTFSAGGVDWLIITHEMWPRQSVIDWMKQVTATHPNHNIIISTHAFIDGPGTLPTSGNYGDQNALTEWNTFVSQYSNIKMVISGHYGPNTNQDGYSYREFTGVNGNKVAAIMTAYHSNYQNHVRLLRIDTADNSISSSIYVSASTNSAYPTGYITDGASNFTTTGMNWVRPVGASPTPPPPANTAPSAPTTVTATAGVNGAAISFAAPSSNGGSPITGYTVTSNPGSITASGSGSPITVSGLASGTSYTFTVKATNAIGNSSASVTSNSVTPYNSSPELLPDPGFETGTGGWTPFIVGTHTRVNSPVRSGANSLKIAATSTTTNYVGMTNNNVISNSVAGKQYTAQCYVQPTNPNMNVIIRFLEYSQNYTNSVTLQTVTTNALPANTWTLVKVTGTAVNTGDRIIPQVYSNNQTTATGTIAYDDCSVTAATPVTAPSAPTSVSATAGNAQADVSFSAPANTGGAAVTSYTVTSTPGNITSVSSSSPVTVMGLTNGTAYTFTVKATNSAGTGSESAVSNTITPAAPVVAPGAPTTLTATGGDDAKTSLAWSAPASNGGSAISDYVIRYRTVGATIWLTYNDGVSTATAATITGLTNGTSYEFAVSAINAVGTGPGSNSVVATPLAPRAPDPVAPDAPTGTTATAGNASAVVSFTAPVSNGGAAITSYTVTSNPGGITASGASSPVTISGLTNGTDYTFSVSAANSAGTGLSSAASNTVRPVAPATTPDAPQSFVATPDDGRVALAWTPPAFDGGAVITDYQIYYRPVGATIWLMADDGVNTTTTATVANLTNNTSYEFNVSAVNVVGAGTRSETITSKPMAAPATVPGTPETVMAVAGHGEVTVSFESPHSNGGSPVTGYTVTSNPGGITASGTETRIVVSGLTNGTAYTFTVTATNAVGVGISSDPSNSATPTAAPTAPQAPQQATAVAGDASATISFDIPASDGGSAITGYTATSIPGNRTASGTGSPLTITGLTNGITYTFTVRASNAIGSSDESAPTASVTPLSPATIPNAPYNLTATPGNGQVALNWSASASDGGAAITDYVIQYRPTGSSIWIQYADGVSAATATTVTGLTNGTAYDFIVSAKNAVGSSAASAISSASPIAPAAPELLPDPGFELGNGGWIPFLVGDITSVTTPVRSGSKALKVAATASTTNWVGLTQNSVVTNSTAGKTYTAQCYVRPTVAGLNINLRFLQYNQAWSANVNIGSTSLTNLPATGWTLVKLSAAATKSGERIVPQIYSSNETTNTGSMLYDDCSVKAQ